MNKFELLSVYIKSLKSTKSVIISFFIRILLIIYFLSMVLLLSFILVQDPKTKDAPLILIIVIPLFLLSLLTFIKPVFLLLYLKRDYKQIEKLIQNKFLLFLHNFSFYFILKKVEIKLKYLEKYKKLNILYKK
ncbi:hypothetical protein ACR34G_03680 [Mycoplasma sp. 480]|uniref:hypothetical protein n=1 Tax=Mycoplasma sp. 480 TaxID=3440155 RepID=UPI003F514BF7